MLCLKHYDKLCHEPDDVSCHVCELDEARSRIAELEGQYETSPASRMHAEDRVAELEAERDRLRVECEAWRAGKLVLLQSNPPQFRVRSRTPYDWVDYPTIDSAVDALIAEREVTP